MAFSRCPFGEKVTPAMKRGFFRRLAPWVDHLAIQKMDLGWFHDPKYIMSVELNDVTPICQPPMRVTPDVEQWLKEWALGQEEVGLVQRAGPYEELPVVTALLTVPGQQHGQKYRVVQNLVPLNKRTKVLHYPMTDVAKVKLALGRAAFLSKIDLKAGFFNVPLAEDSQKYTAFSCAAGRFYWKRMTMGMCNAPAHFQWVMEDIMAGEGDEAQLPVAVLLDDVTVAEDDLQGNMDGASS